jgi:hypothetical protein
LFFKIALLIDSHSISDRQKRQHLYHFQIPL